VTVHLPAAPDTVKLIGAEFFKAMKPCAYLINTSRASLVDEAALREAIQEKGIRAGLDVLDGQPGTSQGDLSSKTLSLPGVYITHHSGASTDQAQAAVADETVRIVKTFMQTGRFENCVNN
jgi:D-3-phosphoglycerate dehydrogenase